MQTRWMVTTLAALGMLSLGACGDSGNGGAGNEDGESLSQGDGDGDGDGDSNGDGDGDGDGDTNGDGDGDGDGDSGDGDGEGEPKFDTLSVPDAAHNCGAGGGGLGDPEFSFLWAANSTQGTISKIDTESVQEMGRYRVRPDSAGSPSRTSVSLSGHVAVANRNGGITKVYATSDHCVESNGQQGIQTSQGANDLLAWGDEECVAWYTQMNYTSQRPAAWGIGTFNEGTCGWEDEELWTSGTNGSTIDVIKLDGDDGSISDMVTLQGVSPNYYGIYGGATDGEGNFWGSQLSIGSLVRVDREDMTYETWPMQVGGYGMTVDEDGYVWTCSSNVARFDPESETWQTAAVSGYTGCMADIGEDGLLWISSGGNSVRGINRETLQQEAHWVTGGAYGVSIDFQGYVWTVAYGSSAYRVDPENGDVVSYNGLVGAYTYSDMTGFAVANAGIPNG